ncbi:MAG TPA: hypothetical protein VK136_03160 [Bacillota bacterium]|nr:hypothetical protein [Bacillota bacterium]
MKKLSFSIHDQHGFFLPSILFVTTLALVVLSVSIQMYRNELEITHNQIEQLRVETLLQMGREQFIDDRNKNQLKVNPVVYSFPHGEIEIQYLQLEEDLYQLHNTISTIDGFSYTISHKLDFKTN